MELHNCKLPKEAKVHSWGAAVTTCYENNNGVLFVDNDEYQNQVNFCPFCGYEAKIKIN